MQRTQPASIPAAETLASNYDLAFYSIGAESRLPHRHVLKKFPRSQYRIGSISAWEIKCGSSSFADLKH